MPASTDPVMSLHLRCSVLPSGAEAVASGEALKGKINNIYYRQPNTTVQNGQTGKPSVTKDVISVFVLLIHNLI